VEEEKTRRGEEEKRGRGEEEKGSFFSHRVATYR
jgi:hypothetical protein